MDKNISGDFHKFCIISLGPGHPELITIEALKALNECETIFVPVRKKDLSWDGSVAYKILSGIKNEYKDWFEKPSEGLGFIQNLEDKFKPLYTPMSYSPDAWTSQVEDIAGVVSKNSKTGFVTLGDVAIYSSAYYLLSIIKEKHPEIYDATKVISGITSLSYGSSKIKKPLCLGNSSLEIVPMHTEDYKSTKVYMRLHKGDDTTNLEGNDLYYFENLGLDTENIGKGTPGIIENYLTVIIDFADQKPPSEKKE